MEATSSQDAPTERNGDLPDDGLDDADAFARDRRRRRSDPRSLPRSGFIGSLPADVTLQKLVAVDPPSRNVASSFNGATDWKQFTKDKLRAAEAEQAQALKDESVGSYDNDSLNDEGTLTHPAILVNPLIPFFSSVSALPPPRPWKGKQAYGEIAASLPVSIGLSVARPSGPSGYTLQPKTSLVDRAGILVPPLPRATSNDSAAAAAARSRSKSISSVARDRTYAVRDIQRSKDPGEALTVPEEDEDEDEYSDGEEESLGTEEQARRRAYRILKRQSDVPDETMWRSLAQ